MNVWLVNYATEADRDAAADDSRELAHDVGSIQVARCFHYLTWEQICKTIAAFQSENDWVNDEEESAEYNPYNVTFFMEPNSVNPAERDDWASIRYFDVTGTQPNGELWGWASFSRRDVEED